MFSMQGSTLHLKLDGELNIYQVEELVKRSLEAFGGASEVAIDLSQVDKIDTAGFQLLVSLKKSCKASQKRFEVAGFGGSVQNFLQLYGFDFDFCAKDGQ